VVIPFSKSEVWLGKLFLGSLLHSIGNRDQRNWPAPLHHALRALASRAPTRPLAKTFTLQPLQHVG